MPRLDHPESAELRRFLKEHLHSGGRMVLVVGEFEVVYSGRAASTAEAGDYLLMVKPDGSVQIHSTTGVKPRNWQPRTDGIRVEFLSGSLVLTAERFKPDEMLRVTFVEVRSAEAIEMRDETSFVLEGSEADMQAALRATPYVIEAGLVVLDEELPTAVGDVDLYCRDAQGCYVVAELKRAKATHDAVDQLWRYVEALRPQLDAPVRGMIVAPDITQPAMRRLVELELEFVQVTALPQVEQQNEQGGLFS